MKLKDTFVTQEMDGEQVMLEADGGFAGMVQRLDRLSHYITTLYRILRCLQNHGAVLITTETNLQYELYLTGLDARLLRRHNRKPIYYVECEER